MCVCVCVCVCLCVCVCVCMCVLMFVCALVVPSIDGGGAWVIGCRDVMKCVERANKLIVYNIKIAERMISGEW